MPWTFKVRVAAFLLVMAFFISVPFVWKAAQNWLLGDPVACVAKTDLELTLLIQQRIDYYKNSPPNNRAIVLQDIERKIPRIEAESVFVGRVLRSPLPNNSAATFQVDLINKSGASIAHASIYDDCWIRFDAK